MAQPPVKLKCKTCKTTFDCPYNKRNERKNCSKQCAIDSRKNSITKNCIICTKVFKIPKSREKRKYKIRCCSKECGWKRERRRKYFPCEHCGKKIFAKLSAFAIGNPRFCSKTCFGKKNRNENNYIWKGDDASYNVKHKWVRYHFGSANHCEDCGLDTLPQSKKRFFDWANISGEYLRIREDWRQLCKPCHKLFDAK